MTQMYFTADGTFGSASEVDIKIYDTDRWTEEMLDAIDGCSDNERQALAEHFADGEHYLAVSELTVVCSKCGLTPQELN